MRAILPDQRGYWLRYRQAHYDRVPGTPVCVDQSMLATRSTACQRAKPRAFDGR
jgi:hypothetical protein